MWGEEGTEWDWYYQEDKEAHERGDPVHPSVMNPPLDIADEVRKETGSNAANLYRTTKKVK